MSLIVATVVFPAVVVGLALGVGLLLEAAGGWRIRGILLALVGIGGLICLSQITTRWGFSAPLTPFVLAVAGIAGYLLRRGRVVELWHGVHRARAVAIGTVGAYVLVIAPVLFGGRVTVPGYLLDTTTGTHLAGAERIVEYGRGLGSLGNDSSYAQYLHGYFGLGYPSGGHTLLGGLGGLFSESLIWLYQPLLATLVALSVPSLYVLVRRAGLGASWGAVAAVLCATPALVYAYTLQGSIKEITALPLICLLGALLVEHRLWLLRGWRTGIPFAVVAAAGLAAIGIAFAAWIAVALAILAVLLVGAVRAGRITVANVAWLVVATAAAAALAALPTVLDATSMYRLASGLSQDNTAFASDPGNLLQPLHAVQALGVWLHGQYRVDPPKHLWMTFALIGAVLIAVALGGVQLVRRNAWVMLAWLVGLLLIWKVLTDRGTTWTDAKLVMLTSPVLAVFAWSGVASLVTTRRRLEAVVLTVVLATGVLWSDALLYHDTNRAPTARYNELISIGKQFAHRGATYLPDFDEFAFYALKDSSATGPGFAFGPGNFKELVGGGGAGYGQSVDLDQVPAASLRNQRLIVVRRSAEASRPPSNYRLVRRGTYYDVWERDPARAHMILRHVGLQSDASATGIARCSEVASAAALARRAGGGLLAAVRPQPVVIRPSRQPRSPAWGELQGGAVSLLGPGRLTARVNVPRAGLWRVWLKGQITRAVHVSVDGRQIGSVAQQTGGEGNYATPLDVRLSPGRHVIELVRLGGGLEPGNGAPAWLDRIVLTQGEGSQLTTVPVAQWRSLCDRPLDWLEVVRPS